MTEDRLPGDQADPTAGLMGKDRALAGAGPARAAIVIIDRDASAREILNRELSKRYGVDYRIVVRESPQRLNPG